MNARKKKEDKNLASPNNDMRKPVLPAHKENEEDTLAFEGGKFCLDVAKLVFAGVILAGIMKEEADTFLLYFTGVIVVLFFVVFGFYLIRKSKKTRR